MKHKETTELIEIYKIHVELTDRVTQRRGQTNKFYTTLLVGFFAFSSFFLQYYNSKWLSIIIGIIGVFICLIWLINIHAYKQLNYGKFIVLNEIEEKLSFQFFKREWELLENGEKWGKYIQHSHIEKFIPVLMSFPYLFIIIYVIIN